ncbi:MAG: hypothetical protein RIR19_403, partial [Chloroflexota bacterium]
MATNTAGLAAQKILVAGAWESSDRPHEIRSPFDGHLVGTTYLASADQVERTQAFE